MTHLDLDALERIARAATKGEWSWTEGQQLVADQWDHPDDLIVETDSGVYPPRKRDREYLVAFQPRTVLALIDLARRVST